MSQPSRPRVLATAATGAGRPTLSGNAGSLSARGDVTAPATWATDRLPVLFAVALTALLGFGYAVGLGRMCRAGQSGQAGRASPARAGSTPAGSPNRSRP